MSSRDHHDQTDGTLKTGSPEGAVTGVWVQGIRGRVSARVGTAELSAPLSCWHREGAIVIAQEGSVRGEEGAAEGAAFRCRPRAQGHREH